MSSQGFRESDLEAGLEALKKATENARAPDRVEAALVAAFRERASAASKPAGSFWLRWALAATAVVIMVVGVTVFLNRLTAPPQPVSVAQPRLVPAPEAPKVIAKAPRQVPRAVRPRVRARDAVDEFIPLVLDQTWSPGESGQVMRVSMPRSALQSFGLPVDESRAFETVKADIVVGQDMVARAIRIVR
jgi:4-amino-4-deoxy-L-arabinose transferase-like glycosyltransferase